MIFNAQIYMWSIILLQRVVFHFCADYTPLTDTPVSDFQDPELEFDEGGLELAAKEGKHDCVSFVYTCANQTDTSLVVPSMCYLKYNFCVYFKINIVIEWHVIQFLCICVKIPYVCIFPALF